MIEIFADTAALLDHGYRGRDFVRRPQANLDALAPQEGDPVLDIWYGTVILLADLAQCVGPDGSATGMDPNADVVGTATDTCA